MIGTMPPSVSTTIGSEEQKIQTLFSGFEHHFGMAEGDPLDRAFADFDAVMLYELVSRVCKRLIGREVHDHPLQGTRAAQSTDLGAEHERAHALVLQPILRLQHFYVAEFRVPAEFFLPWRCREGCWRISCSVTSTRFSAQP